MKGVQPDIDGGAFEIVTAAATWSLGEHSMCICGATCTGLQLRSMGMLKLAMSSAMGATCGHEGVATGAFLVMQNHQSCT